MQWAYGAVGEKPVTMTLGDGRSAHKSLQVVEATPKALVIPAAISQAGAYGTQWESDFRFFNPCNPCNPWTNLFCCPSCHGLPTARQDVARDKGLDLSGHVGASWAS